METSSNSAEKILLCLHDGSKKYIMLLSLLGEKGREQRVLHDLYRTRHSRVRSFWLLAHTLPLPLPSVSDTQEV
jgi:hypothetical protein